MKKTQTALDHYGEVHNIYDSSMRRTGEIMDLLEKEAFLRIAKNPNPSSALDLGCGTGRFCFFLSSIGYTPVTGVDSSAEMIAIAEKKRKKEPISFVVEDATVFLKKNRKKYPFVTAMGLFSFVPAPEFVSLVSKNTANDGFFFFDFVNKYNLFAQAKFFFDPVKRNFYSFGQIKSLLEKNGFETIGSQGIYFFPGPKSIIEKNNSLRNAWMKIDRFIGKLPLVKHLFGYRIIVFARKNRQKD